MRIWYPNEHDSLLVHMNGPAVPQIYEFRVIAAATAPTC